MILENVTIGTLFTLIPIILAVAVTLLYRKTGHSDGLSVFLGILSMAPLWLLAMPAFGLITIREYMSYFAVGCYIAPCLILIIALKKWPNFDPQEKLKDVF